MSHITKIDTVITDLEALKAGCSRNGWTFVEGQKTYEWFNTFVGDVSLPKGLKVEDLGKCDHAIRVPGCRYEVGVVKRQDGSGYELRWDYFEGKLQTALGGQKAGRLIQAYAVEAAKRKAAAAGHRVISERTLPNGEIHLEVQA